MSRMDHTDRPLQDRTPAHCRAGLIAGLVFYFSGRPEIANLIWIAGVTPALAALVVEIIRSLRSGEVGLDIVAALSMSAALASARPSPRRSSR
jgi:hypothetical protein